MKAVIDQGTSIFDPVLCELMYTWFSHAGGLIIDPFAGGSVRGIVASALGRHYIGIDLRDEQVDANRTQADALCRENMPVWHVGDSSDIDKICGKVEADFLFSCPPYADLEKYSDNPRDLSNMKYDDFVAAYREIIKKSCSLLKDNRFAAFVVGEVRGKGGEYYNFVGDTVQAFLDAELTMQSLARVMATFSSPRRGNFAANLIASIHFPSSAILRSMSIFFSIFLSPFLSLYRCFFRISRDFWGEYGQTCP